MNLKKKLAVFLAILFSLNLFAQAPGETITISFQNIPLSEAIKKIHVLLRCLKIECQSKSIAERPKDTYSTSDIPNAWKFGY